jgi:hypothetical protein
VYKIQKGNLPYTLSGIGMVTMLFAGALLFISVPSMFYVKPYVNFNSVPSIFLSALLFLFGYWLNRIFPAVRIAKNGIRCKHMYFYGLIKWSEMDNMIDLKNGVMGLSIKRQGSPFLNGLFFEWLTGKALRQRYPLLLFTPEFFADKKVPQEIIANTPESSGINAYLKEKITGVVFINPSRFSIQDVDNGVLITIPGKKNILEAIFFVPMALLWSYFAGYMIYFFALINFGVILAFFQDTWDSKIYITFAIMDIFTFLFISFVVLWIWVVLESTIRHMTGKEIIETNGQALTITKQILWRRKSSEFPSGSITNLRVDVIKPGLLTAPFRAFQSALGRNGIIVFEFEGKTVRFGLDITEDEGKYIMTALKSGTNK